MTSSFPKSIALDRALRLFAVADCAGPRRHPIPVLFQMGGVVWSYIPHPKAPKADGGGARWSSLALATDLALFGQGQSLTVFSMIFPSKNGP